MSHDHSAGLGAGFGGLHGNQGVEHRSPEVVFSSCSSLDARVSVVGRTKRAESEKCARKRRKPCVAEA
eukprot:10256506-Alexandrium_andersonii.AAC.1